MGTRSLLLHCIPPLVAIVVWPDALNLAHAWSPITITTRATLPHTTTSVVYNFLATPGNWPTIVASSVGVSSSSSDVNVQDEPLPVGGTVTEVFGLPPLLPLSVEWTRTPSSSSSLDFVSATGLAGVASDCRMRFRLTPQTDPTGCAVQLDMEYQPTSLLAVLAVPILTLDNALALQFLLPAALRPSMAALDAFRSLMGWLYGIAGLAHAADCVVGDSQLLTMAGAPTFYDLPRLGQLYALLWCTMGPVVYGLQASGGKNGGYADLGLVLYGLVEVVGAGLVQAMYFGGSASDATILTNPLVNAVLVQAIVAGAWFYSANKREDNLAPLK